MRTNNPRLVAMLQHETNNAEESLMRDFLSRLQPSVRTFIEMREKRPTTVVEMEALVMHWCDITPGRATGRINELTTRPSTNEPLDYPGSVYSSAVMDQPATPPTGLSTPLDYRQDHPGMPDVRFASDGIAATVSTPSCYRQRRIPITRTSGDASPGQAMSTLQRNTPRYS